MAQNTTVTLRDGRTGVIGMVAERDWFYGGVQQWAWIEGAGFCAWVTIDDIL